MQKNNENHSLQDLEGEIWKDILEFEGYYQVSNMGRVKSLHRVIHKSNGRIMTFKPKILLVNKHYKNNYNSVFLRVFDKFKRKSLHRAVAECFLEPIENKPFQQWYLQQEHFAKSPFRMKNSAGSGEFGIGWHKAEDFTLDDFTSFTGLKLIIKL